MNDITEFGRWLAKTMPTLNSFPDTPSKEVERHHILGRHNSALTIPLPKNWHAFITRIQNKLPLQCRKDTTIFTLLSIATLLMLLALMLLRAVWERVRQ